MAFKSVRTEYKTIKTQEMELNQVLEGYVTRIKESKSEHYPESTNVTLFMTLSDGEKVVVFASGNLKFLDEQLKDAGAPMGTKIRAIRIPKPKGTKYKSYFDIQFDADDVLDLSEYGSEDDGQQEM